jgi:hypothetical protein
MPAFLAAVAAGGRLAPAKPALIHTGPGQVTISNYDATITYQLAVNFGTATRAGAVITTTAAASTLTVTPTSPRGITGPSSMFTRQPYTTTPVADIDPYSEHALPAHGAPNYGGAPGTTFIYCNDFGGGFAVHNEGHNVKNATPSGFTDAHGEWAQTT